MVRVKICGITNVEDALMAVEAGADALGFVFFQGSPRYVPPEQAEHIIRALPPFVQTVGLFVNEEATTVNAIADHCGIDVVQLHGDESPEYCTTIRRRVIKALRVKNAASLESLPAYQPFSILLDAWSPAGYGGTGETFNWALAASVAATRPVILAGGLTPDNVAAAIAAVHPYAVDVSSSGVEKAPGKKDARLVQQFVTAARKAS